MFLHNYLSCALSWDYLTDSVMVFRCDGSVANPVVSNYGPCPFIYMFPPLAFLHSTNSCQVTAQALLWYLLSLTLLLISSVIRPDQPALWIALSTASILSHP